MELIIDFYKSLDTLNLIIFWGIIIVIILLLIFSFILINKNKKLKKLVEDNKHEVEIPIKKEELANEDKIIEDNSEFIPTINETQEEINSEQEEKSPKTENKFIAEEHVIEYNNTSKEKKNNHMVDIKPSIEMPTGPYQRNVLREMSLSQTSPIGINRQQRNEDKKVELVKDLEDSLNERETEILTKEETIQNNSSQIDIQIKKELSNLENNSPRKTVVRREIKPENPIITSENYEEEIKELESSKMISEHKYSNSTIENSTKELLNSQPTIVEEKSSSEQYLEEVSRKLSEAEIPDEIERTNYELQQEEDAIISYKELMEKKDSIQTIDEEDAIISIEELMNRNNQSPGIAKEESKLYNLSEEEENDNFIKELKQFRNDL